MVGVYVALLLIGLFAITGSRAGRSEWFQHGEADATRMMAGEWWRAVTALTLHADAPHLLGNAVAGALLVTAVCQQLGPGVGLWLVPLAGGRRGGGGGGRRGGGFVARAPGGGVPPPAGGDDAWGGGWGGCGRGGVGRFGGPALWPEGGGSSRRNRWYPRGRPPHGASVRTRHPRRAVDRSPPSRPGPARLWRGTARAGARRASRRRRASRDRKSTRLNSSHDQISYAVFCLKKKKPCSTTISFRNNIPHKFQTNSIGTVLSHPYCAHDLRRAAWCLI